MLRKADLGREMEAIVNFICAFRKINGRGYLGEKKDAKDGKTDDKGKMVRHSEEAIDANRLCREAPVSCS